MGSVQPRRGRHLEIGRQRPVRQRHPRHLRLGFPDAEAVGVKAGRDNVKVWIDLKE
jgi:hypothetical protein